jgi:hypothetical protein
MGVRIGTRVSERADRLTVLLESLVRRPQRRRKPAEPTEFRPVLGDLLLRRRDGEGTR